MNSITQNFGLSGLNYTGYHNFLGIGKKARERREQRAEHKTERKEHREERRQQKTEKKELLNEKRKLKNDLKQAQIEEKKVQTAALSGQMQNNPNSPAPKEENNNTILIAVVTGVVLLAGTAYVMLKKEPVLAQLNKASA